MTEDCVLPQSLTAYVDKDFQTSVVVEKKIHKSGLRTQRYVRIHKNFISATLHVSQKNVTLFICDRPNLVKHHPSFPILGRNIPQGIR